MSLFRCAWCGKFYSSELPDGSACREHIPEHNVRLAKDIAQFNAKLKPAQPAADRAGRAGKGMRDG